MSKEYKIYYSTITSDSVCIKAESAEQAAEVFYQQYTTTPESFRSYLIDEIVENDKI